MDGWDYISMYLKQDDESVKVTFLLVRTNLQTHLFIQRGSSSSRPSTIFVILSHGEPGKQEVSVLSPKMDFNDTEENGNEWCDFCSIARGQDDEADVLKKTKDLVCFRDICPAAPHHYLVVPTQHIESCFSLNNGHIKLVERMAEMARAVLLDSGVTDMKDIRLGFHQPPYISVRHLHLHVLAPASRISESMLYKFLPGTSCFVNEKRLRKRLKVKKWPPIDSVPLNATCCLTSSQSPVCESGQQHR
ncbi:adenosine 5'-monophosphoramidase HINT3-like [Nerophis lumbriciformis]|uniref:adenosine 5'-monophosphoramidase HINT3-like n=1 Tax=Nerophis lumbriciformis TaxID=546530 RepID=UPI002ADF42D0|nr:adenosine 5'-monophosphoramidase HINT3-like [Nerophis lumbriciformis]